VLKDAATAASVLAQALGSDSATWRQLASEHSPPRDDSPAADKTTARPAESVPGDLGMLSRVEVAPGGVPTAVRDAVFQIAAEGEVHGAMVAAEGRYYIVRLVTLVAPRQRSLAEADAAVRVHLVAERQRQAEAALIERLRKTIPVSIDEQALSEVETPSPAIVP
jgi:hypothetical protein